MSNTPITPNHMNVYWHDYTGHAKNTPVGQAGLAEKASLIGRAGLMLLSCGTGAWRVRSSMNTLAQELGIICNANIGLLSIDYTCFDGKQSISHSLSLSSTGVNTSKLNRMERFIKDFTKFGRQMTVGQLHSQLDEIDKIHGLYSPLMQGFASGDRLLCFLFSPGRRPHRDALYIPGRRDWQRSAGPGCSGGSLLCFCALPPLSHWPVLSMQVPCS